MLGRHILIRGRSFVLAGLGLEKVLRAECPALCHLVTAEAVPSARAKWVIRLSLLTGASSLEQTRVSLVRTSY